MAVTVSINLSPGLRVTASAAAAAGAVERDSLSLAPAAGVDMELQER
jgi:hypothetical protein